ncbi:hypothetical protein [Kribbella sp. NPDC051770]|uniref:hypothetical protein n=1 Tax=Kribbella sp. NPDC051770 TaxID=3155413 RepID=UPI003443DA5A
MPSDLQRVARGLVECLDEVPQVVQHLQRTADRCRENAALAIVASQGRATVAAQQLDAAARACEAAAHYLSMAPPKARAWAERLVGDGRSSSRPDEGSADRNKATGGGDDVAEQDVFGRTRRLTARFKPLEAPEEGEPPLVRVARKAFEKLRKRQEKDAEEREKEQPEEELEVEIVVDPKGELRAAAKESSDSDSSEEDGEREEPEYEIAVDLGEAARELLEAMTAAGEQAWERAELVIAVDRVTASFEYGEAVVVPEVVVPVVDVELPAYEEGEAPGVVEVPEIAVEVGETEFDPAFTPRSFGVDFSPAVHDPLEKFDEKEQAIADRLVIEGWRVDARPENHEKYGLKNPDAMVRRDGTDPGRVTEFKRLDSASPNGVKRSIERATDQVEGIGEVVIDGRMVDLGYGQALRAFRRACAQAGRTVAPVVHVILGDGRLVTYEREN